LKADSASSPLPDYLRPPVIEVVYGMQFLPLTEWRSPLVGLLWQSIKQDYPKFKEMPVLAPMIERFDPVIQTEESSLQLFNAPPLPRLFFMDANENWVMQVQNDRFLHNWKRVKDEDEYPRYGLVSERFYQAWEIFLRFCSSENIATPKLTQLEVTYINHIAIKSNPMVDELNSLFPDIQWQNGHSFLRRPERILWNVSFLLPEAQGRLHISLRPGQRRKDKTPMLLLELTARGIPASTEMDKIREWFALGREWIVRGFADITSVKEQKGRWQRTN